MKKIMSLFLSLLMCLSVGTVSINADDLGEHQHLSTSQGTVIKESTCTETGIIEYTCDDCQEIYQEDIPLKEHNYVDGICSTCEKHQPYIEWIVDKTDNEIYEEYNKLVVEDNNDLIEELLACLSEEQQTLLNNKTEDNKEPELEEELPMLMMAPLMGSAQDEGIETVEEFASALASGGEIKLLDDIDYESLASITIVGETTIDLNGHALNITTGSNARYSINVGVSGDNEPKLIIKDSSEDEIGVLNVTNTYTSTAAYIFEVYGTLDIQGGTINQTATKASSYGINMCNGGILNVSGGTIKKGTNIGSGYSLRTSTSSTSTITDGVIEDYYGTTGLIISGGIFKTQPTYEMMKPGYITYKITDEGATKGWYGVKEGTYVGLVGTTVYTDVVSFANAIGGNKIIVEGTKLTLTDDINLGSASANKVTYLSDITIDLAGHTITGAVAGSSAYMFYVNQKDITVTIIDTVGGGKVDNSTSGYCYTVMVNKGTFVVDGAKIVGKTTGTSTTTVITNGSTSSSDPKVVLKNGAFISVENGNTAKSSSTGIQNYGICEIDDSTVEVTSGSGATAISPYNSSSILRIGKNSTGKSTIKAVGTGKNTTQATTMCVIGKGSSGGSGEIYISNADIVLTTDKGESTKAQTSYTVYFGSASNGTYEIGDNVSISASGTCGTANEIYGLRAEGGGTISGSNVSIDVEGENAKTRYGLYLTNKTNLKIEPGTGVTVEVNKDGYTSGTDYVSYASSTGVFEISGGIYKGGTLGGLLLTGGTFDLNPSDFCDLGFIAKANTPSEGLWTIVPDDRTIVKNLTQDKEYGSIVTAIEEAHDHDELQLMENISSNSELTLASVNLDLNGHNISLKTINTTGDVTITDKKATSFEDAGTLTAAINAGPGNTLISKCNHNYSTNDYNFKPFNAKGTENTTADLNISGVNGNYTFDSMTQYFAIAVKGDSRVLIDNNGGFVTNLKLTSSGQNPKLIDCSGNNNEATINNGEFNIVCTGTTAGVSAAFGNSIKALVNDGKFIIESKNQTEAKIASSANANLNIQGGYYVGLGNSGEVDKDTFFANATYLGQNGRNSKALESTDPLYADGYRYTVAEVAVARIGDTNYMSVQSAIKAANDGDTITLLSNTVARELVLNKDVTFEGDYTVTLTGDKPLTLGSGIEKPDCFDASDAMVLIEKNNGDKIYYKYWVVYGSSSVAASTDYNAEDDKQIVLVKNISLTSSWIINKDLTIDLNGFSIIDNDCSYETINLRGEHTITIKDSSTDKTGKITGKNESYTVLIQGNGTTFILESGIIENISENGAGICAIGDSYHLSEDTTITINGGKVVTNDGFAIVDNGQYSINNAININGGEIESKGVAIYHPASGTMTLNGGTISGNTGIYIRSGKLIVPEDSTVQVKATGAKGSHRPSYSGGAEGTGDAIAICESDYPGGKVSVEICNGAFYSLNNFAIASYATTGQTPIKGFLKGGIYGAGSDRIDIMDVADIKDLIAEGYKDIKNPDTNTNEEHPWMIGTVNTDVIIVDGDEDNPTEGASNLQDVIDVINEENNQKSENNEPVETKTIVVTNIDVIEAEIDDKVIIVAKPVLDVSGNDTNDVTAAPGYKLNEPEDAGEGNKSYTATALDIGKDYLDRTDGSGVKDSKKTDTELKQSVEGTTQAVKDSALSVKDTNANKQLEKIVHDDLNTILSNRGIHQGTAAKALNNADIKITNEGTGEGVTAAKNVNVYVLTYYDTEVLEDKTTQTNMSYKLDITPMYQAYASTATSKDNMKTEGTDKDSVKIGESLPVDCTGKTITLRIELPDGFITNANQKVYVIHHSANGIKTYNTTVTKESDEFYIEFTNPDGFSAFEITLKNPNPTPTPTPTPNPKPRYKVPNTGVKGIYGY